VARKLAAEKNLDLAGMTGSGPGGRIVLEDVERALESPPGPGTKRAPEGRLKASPAARRLAAEKNLDLAGMTGSGPGGRIVLEDVERALEGPPAPPAGEVREVPDKARIPAGMEVAESIPIAGVRRVIFDNMYMSLSQTAQLTLQTDASAEAIVSLRNDFQENGAKISYNAVLIKACAMALRRHPRINASVDGDRIQVWKNIHVGLAMEANEDLVVPVVRSPDLRTIPEIEENIKTLMERIGENKLSPDDLAHGTFTVSNLGFAGVDHFTPIIRPPESAVLGVGRIAKKAVVRENLVMPESRIGLSLTFDHRIIDGAPAGRFLKTIVEMIEKPALMFI
jgi:pyruvate/2-oxoglutarate dehydrogenase complex dihydrolipoamide acyltransferase (E2) component